MKLGAGKRPAGTKFRWSFCNYGIVMSPRYALLLHPGYGGRRRPRVKTPLECVEIHDTRPQGPHRFHGSGPPYRNDPLS